MFKHFCFKKLSYCHQYIFLLIACIQPDVVLNSSRKKSPPEKPLRTLNLILTLT